MAFVPLKMPQQAVMCHVAAAGRLQHMGKKRQGQQHSEAQDGITCCNEYKNKQTKYLQYRWDL